MAGGVGSIISIILEANTASFVTNIPKATKLAQREFARMEKEAQMRTNAIKRAFKDMFLTFAGVGTVLQTVKVFGQMSDQYKNMVGLLTTVTKSQQELAAAMSHVPDIANRTLSSLEGTVTLYQRTQQATRALGLSQKETLQITETINKAMQVSGATTIQYNAAVQQLAQGFNKGRLDGDEFNSVMENAPRIQQILVKELRVTAGQLREMAFSGKLSAEMLVTAFQKAAKEIDEEFKNVPLTIGRAWTLIRNNAVIAIGEIEKQLNTTGFLADMMVGFADFVRMLPNAMSNLVSEIKNAFSESADVIAGFWSEITGMSREGLSESWEIFTGFSDNAQDLFEDIKMAFLTFPQTWKFAATAVIAGVDILWTYMKGFISDLKGSWDALWIYVELVANKAYNGLIRATSTAAGYLTESLGKALGTVGFDTIAGALQERADYLLSGQTDKIKELEASYAELEKTSTKSLQQIAIAEILARDELERTIEVAKDNLAIAGREANEAQDRVKAQKALAEASEERYDAQKKVGLSDKEQAKLDAIAAREAKKREAAARAQAEPLRGLDKMYVKFPKETLPSVAAAYVAQNAAIAELIRRYNDAYEKGKKAGDQAHDMAEANKKFDATLIAIIEHTKNEVFAIEQAIIAYNKRIDVSGRAVREMQDEIDVLSQTNDERELEARMRDAVNESISLAIELKNKELVLDKEKQRQLREDLQDKQRELNVLRARLDLQEDFEGIMRSAMSNIGEEGPWRALSNAAVSAADNISEALGRIVRNSDSVGEGFRAIGRAAFEALPAVGEFMGAAVGGGGQGAQVGAQLGGALASYFGPVGSFVGALIGGAIGGMFDDDPGIQVAGTGGNISGRVEQTRTSAFGTFRVRTEEAMPAREVADAIEDFDRAVASLLSSDQIAAATARLAEFDINFENGAATIPAVLQARFDEILATITPLIGDFVDGFSNDLQQRVQALGDVLALERLAEDDDLITGTLEQTLDLIDEFGRAGETVGQTYQWLSSLTEKFSEVLTAMGIAVEGGSTAIARLAAELSEAAGSAERASSLLTTYFENFYDESERATVALTRARSTAGSEFGDIGLDPSAFFGEGGMAAFRAAFEEILPTLSAEAQVQWLEAAEALAAVTAAQAAYNETLGTGGETIEDFMENIEARLREARPELAIEEQIAAQEALNAERLAQAEELNASEEQLALVRELNQLELNALLEEQEEILRGIAEALEAQARAAEELSLLVARLNAEGAGGITNFTSELDRVNTQYEANVRRLNELAIAAGRTGASTEELSAATAAWRRQVAALTAQLIASAQSLIARLYGRPSSTSTGTTGGGYSFSSGSTGTIGTEVDNAIRDRYETELGYLQQIQDFLDSLDLSNLSPLTPQERLMSAQNDYQTTLAAALGGDLDALGRLQEVAQSYLQEAQGYYGGVGAYRDIYAAVREALQGIVDRGPLTPVPDDPPTPIGVEGGTTEATVVEPGEGFVELSELERFTYATELVAVLRDLITASNMSLAEVSESLGLDLAQLVADLGVNLNDLTVATTVSLSDIARSLGVDLSELAASVGADLGDLADEQSLLNDALEQVLLDVPEEFREQIRGYLEDIEAATTEADANAAIAAAEEAINNMPAGIADLLAPFFGGVSSPTDALLLVTMGQAEDVSYIRGLLEEGLSDPPAPTAADKSAAVVSFQEPEALQTSGSVVYMKDFLARVEAAQRAASKSAAESAAASTEALARLRSIDNNTRPTPNRRSM